MKIYKKSHIKIKMDDYEDLKPKNELNLSNNNSSSKYISNLKEIKADNFEENLNISDIREGIIKTNQILELTKNNNICQNNINQNLSKDFSEDLSNINDDEFNQRKISICSLQSEEFNCSNININLNTEEKKENDLINKKITKKLTKKDLNNIPLPVFSCIFCSNDIIAFKHLLLENISNKYLFQTSIYDIREINKLLLCQPIIDKDDKNEKLIDIIIKNSEYINKTYNNDKITSYFKSIHYFNLCNKEYYHNKKYLIQKIEESIIKKKKDFYFKGINKISKNSLNNKCLFNSTNSMINNYNALSGLVETIPINNNVNMGKINNVNNSNLSINSISLNNNETGNNLCKDNNNLLISIVEHIENNVEPNEIEDKEEIIDFFGFEMERKITKENIIWENKYYDIWNPNISDEEENDEIIDNLSYLKTNEINNKENKSGLNEKRIRLKVNLLKSKTSNNSFSCQINKKLNVSQIKSLGSTNSSSVINVDNENKIKSNIISYSKDIINNSELPIHVNTIQINKNTKNLGKNTSIIINKSISLKSPLGSKYINNGLINSHIKLYPNFTNNRNIFKTLKAKNKIKCHLINKKNLNSNPFNYNPSNTVYNTNNSIDINSSKYKKNKKKILENNKIKGKNILQKRNNKNYEFSRKINKYNVSNSYIINNYINKTMTGTKLSKLNTTFSTLKNEASKKMSSKMSFKKSKTNKTSFIKNNSKKNIQKNNNLRKSNVYNKINEKDTLGKIRAKISEIIKLINNNKLVKEYNYYTNNKQNSSSFNANPRRKNLDSKSKNEINLHKYKNNKTNKIENKNNSKKNLYLTSSFLYKKKEKLNKKK